MLYLAGPYTDDDREVMDLRFVLLSQIGLHYMNEGQAIMSPITHGHMLEHQGVSTIKYPQWIAHGLWALQNSRGMVVCELPGWEDSKGVQIEIEYAKVFDIEYENFPLENIKLLPTVQVELIDRLEEILRNRNVTD